MTLKSAAAELNRVCLCSSMTRGLEMLFGTAVSSGWWIISSTWWAAGPSSAACGTSPPWADRCATPHTHTHTHVQDVLTCMTNPFFASVPLVLKSEPGAWHHPPQIGSRCPALHVSMQTCQLVLMRLRFSARKTSKYYNHGSQISGSLRGFTLNILIESWWKKAARFIFLLLLVRS